MVRQQHGVAVHGVVLQKAAYAFSASVFLCVGFFLWKVCVLAQLQVPGLPLLSSKSTKRDKVSLPEVS